jgi:hypothetical protein
MNCQVYGCSEKAPKELVMHVLYWGETHHFRMCRTHHKLLKTNSGRWRIRDIKQGLIDIKLDMTQPIAR